MALRHCLVPDHSVSLLSGRRTSGLVELGERERVEKNQYHREDCPVDYLPHLGHCHRLAEAHHTLSVLRRLADYLFADRFSGGLVDYFPRRFAGLLRWLHPRHRRHRHLAVYVFADCFSGGLVYFFPRRFAGLLRWRLPNRLRLHR